MADEVTTELKGSWWRPETPTRRVAGTLTISYPLELRLDGALIEDPPATPGTFISFPNDTADRADVVLGVTVSGDKVTVFDSWGGSFGMPSEIVQNELWRPRVALIGDHFNRDVRFDEVWMTTEYLWDWSGAPRHRTNFDSGTGELQILANRQSLMKAVVAGTRYELLSDFRTSPSDRSGITLEDDVTWHVRPSESLTWYAIVDDVVVPLQALATFCTMHSNRVARLEIRPVGATRTVRVVTWLRGSDLPERDLKSLPPQVQVLPGWYFFPRSNRILRNWFRIRGDLDAVLNRLLSVDYAASMYLEHRSASIIQAAEALHRAQWDRTRLSKKEHKIRRKAVMAAVADELRPWLSSQITGRNDLSLRERITDVVERAERAGLPYDVTSRDDFVQAVLRSRNTGAHGSSGGADFEEQYWRASGLAWLIRTLLLSELGLTSDEIFELLSGNEELRFCARRLSWSRLSVART